MKIMRQKAWRPRRVVKGT